MRSPTSWRSSDGLAQARRFELEEDAPIGLHNLKPAKGSRHRRKRLGRGEGSGTGKTAGRGHKGAGARSGAKRKVGFEGGQNPIHMRMRKLRGPHMKKSMPFEKFRTHTQPVNVERPRGALREGRRGHARRARGCRVGHAQGHAGQDPGSGRADQAADRARPCVLGIRAGQDRGRRRHRAGHRRLIHAADVPELVSGGRDSEEARLHRGDADAVPHRRLHPGARHQHRGRQGHLRQLPGVERPRLPEPLLGRQPSALRDLRAGDHALHHRLDHPPADDGGHPVAGEAPQGGRGRPAEDHAIHPLPHRRPGVRAVHRLRLLVPQLLHGHAPT